VNECSLIKNLNSENIVACEDVYDFDQRIWVFLELMEGDLSKIIMNTESNYSEAFCKFSLFSVARGLQTMHYKNVLHRDIKSENILIRKNGDIKIADLGLSVFLHEQQMFRNSLKGTSNWFSPEIANGVFYSKEVDVWAFGCLAYELATGKPPFFEHARDDNSLFTAILNKQIKPIDTNKWSPVFADFINCCLEKNPQERSTID